MILPKLYKKTSTGKIQMWEIEAYGSDNLAYIKTVYGQTDGEKQVASEVITKGKNIGKSNETTPLEQAKLDIKSKWEQKKKKGYVETLDDAEQGKVDTTMIIGGVAPMLAHKYDEQGHKIKYPAYIQPKLDGHRCVAIIQNGKCTLWSRTQKPINSLPHIQRALETLFSDNDIILDGELYNHDYREKFEQLTSFIRQENPKPGHEVVQYWVYDLVDNNLPFELRVRYLAEKLRKNVSLQNTIVFVDTMNVDTQEEMINSFGVYLNYGFEGLMVRNAHGKYVNKRSYDLQKVKLFQDAEFRITDITEGNGKMAGCAMFHVVTPDGGDFRVKMVGPLDDLKHYYDHKEDYIGKDLTVKFQKLSADGIPIFPVGMRIRSD